MIKFWLIYWLSAIHFGYLASFKSKQTASAFVEHFTFIMHMKDLVKLQLSMRKLAQIYHFVEPRLANTAHDLEKTGNLRQTNGDSKDKPGIHRQKRPQAALLPQFSDS